MGFEELERRLRELRAQRDAGALDAARFEGALAELRTTDAQGAWWQLDGQGQWLRWDGTQWQPAQPPRPLQPPASSPRRGDAAAARTPGAPAVAARAMAELQRRTVDPREFLRQAREVPLAQRSQGWWDLAAILGGVTGGYLWFVYSSVRGLPLPRFLFSGGRESWFDFFPAAGLLGLPVVIGALWVAFGPRLQAAAARLGAAAKLGLACAVALPLLFLYFWPSIDPWIFPRLFQVREGTDAITPILTAAIPLLLVWFRRETDAMLRPLQPLRRPVPRVVLVGAGLSVPFVISVLLYLVGMMLPGSLRGFFIQYPYVRLSVVIGTLVSYVILRTPQEASPPAAPRGGGAEDWQARAGAGQAVARSLLTVLAWLASAALAGADDFFRDPFNLNDGLRTNSVAPLIAGALVTVITVLVNGVEVVQTIFHGTDPTRKPGDTGPGKRKDFRVVVDTVDRNGQRATDLSPDANPFLFVYAHCEELGKGRFPAGDASISFAAQFDPRWATLQDQGMAQGRRCAKVTLAEPFPAGDPPKALIVLVSAGQAVSDVPVQLTLGAPAEVVVSYEPQRDRQYRSFRLARGPEFVADEEDVLKPIVYVRRRGKTPEEILPSKIELRLLPAGSDFKVETDPSFKEPNKVRGLVRSTRLLLETGAAGTLELEVRAKVKGPSGAEVELAPFKSRLEPRRVYLKLWVVPSKQGRSEAGVFACLAPSAGDPYKGLQLQIKTESVGGAGRLTPEATEAATDAQGLARFTLGYSGITWDNFNQAQFKVKAAARTKSGLSEATCFDVDVAANLRAMITAMDADRPKLQIDNPYFHGPDWNGYVTAGIDKVTCNRLRGPLWNIRCITIGEGPSNENTYVCQQYLNRLYAWMEKRRLGDPGCAPEDVAPMNGLEPSRYAIAPLHWFAGVHFGGTKPDDDPRFIDPWWTQEWGELLDWKDEMIRCAGVAGPLATLLAVLLVKMVAAIGGWVAIKVGAMGTAEAAAAIEAWLSGKGTLASYAWATSAATPVAVGTYRAYAGSDNPNVSADGSYTSYRYPVQGTAEKWVREKRAVGVVASVESF